MVYVIEISFSTKGCGSIEILINKLYHLSERYYCTDKHHMTEVTNDKYNNQYIYVFSCTFDVDDVHTLNDALNISNFIKDVKKNRKFKIDMIRNEDIICDVIYVSPYYLRNMMYEERANYIKNQRQRSYSETDYLILRQFKKELSEYNENFVVNNKNFIMSYDAYIKMITK
jgi:hypothetical protein